MYNKKNNEKTIVNPVTKLKYAVVLLWCFMHFHCQQESKTIASTYHYIKPQYNQLELQSTTDTLSIRLNDSTYNAIKSFNLFCINAVEYISFYDQRSQSINIYNFALQKPVKSILLKKCLKGQQLLKTTVYCKNFDSIFINNTNKLYLIDSSGAIKKIIKFLSKPPLAWASFENTTPPAFKNNRLFTAVRPFVKETSLAALEEWKVLYEFDLKSSRARLHYNLPEFFRKNLFGHRFLQHSYCINNRGNFVISFYADSNIYETDLASYHIAYSGKSQYQENIQSVSKSALQNDKGSISYFTSDSYGAIYFDRYRNRYLRITKSKISEADYTANKRKKKQHVIILNEDFKIISETSVDENILLDSLFFTKDGSMYARINPEDEYALHFIRLKYSETKGNEIQLTKNESFLNK